MRNCGHDFCHSFTNKLGSLIRIKRRTLINYLNKMLRAGTLHSEKRGRFTHYYHLPINVVRYRRALKKALKELLNGERGWENFQERKRELREKYGVEEDG